MRPDTAPSEAISLPQSQPPAALERSAASFLDNGLSGEEGVFSGVFTGRKSTELDMSSSSDDFEARRPPYLHVR